MTSEAELNGLQAAAVGVPVGVLTGDNVICEIAAAQFPGIRTVTVKTAVGHFAADSLSPAAACERIRNAAFESVSDGGAAPVSLQAPLVLEIDMPTPVAAELGALMPTIERLSSFTLRGTFETPRDALGFVMLCSELASSGLRAKLPLLNRV